MGVRRPGRSSVGVNVGPGVGGNVGVDVDRRVGVDVGVKVNVGVDVAVDVGVGLVVAVGVEVFVPGMGTATWPEIVGVAVTGVTVGRGEGEAVIVGSC